MLDTHLPSEPNLSLPHPLATQFSLLYRAQGWARFYQINVVGDRLKPTHGLENFIVGNHVVSSIKDNQRGLVNI